MRNIRKAALYIPQFILLSRLLHQMATLDSRQHVAEITGTDVLFPLITVASILYTLVSVIVSGCMGFGYCGVCFLGRLTT